MYVRVATPPLAGLMQENKMQYNQDMLFTQNNQNHNCCKQKFTLIAMLNLKIHNNLISFNYSPITVTFI